MFTGCKVFSTTMVRDRAVMGEAVTDWLAANGDLEVVQRDVLQSSDNEYHCLSIVLWFRQRPAERKK